MPIPVLAYDCLCSLYGEQMVRKFYSPISVLSGYSRPR